MNKIKTLSVLIGFMSTTSAFAAWSGQVCKGAAKSGAGMTVIRSYGDRNHNQTIQINAQGQSYRYLQLDTVDAGDVAAGFRSTENGGLKVTFYDQDSSASGWAKVLGPFKLSCKETQ